MFTGLVEEVGTVLWIRATERGTQLEIGARNVSPGSAQGESIAVNGCCLTVTAHRADRLTFDLLEETLNCTNLKDARPGTLVNLERPLAMDGRLGGHFVQGHIDCATTIVGFEKEGPDWRLEVALPPEFAHYVVHKGSIAVNGISLTVAEVLPKSFAVWIIPQTRRQTNLQSAAVGDRVNLEFDLLAKYVERMLAPSARPD